MEVFSPLRGVAGFGHKGTESAARISSQGFKPGRTQFAIGAFARGGPGELMS